MTMEPNPTSGHILNWLEDSLSFFPSFLDDPYNSGDIEHYQLWDQGQDIGHYQIIGSPDVAAIATNIAAVNNNSTPPTDQPSSSINLPSCELPRKRKNCQDSSLKPLSNQKHKKSQTRSVIEAENGDAVVEGTTVKKYGGNKIGGAKGNGNNCNNGNNKEGRWAEQLLNPCAAAITAGQLNLVQHLLYVLHELASATGDANHRLATHGLGALAQHLSSSTTCSSSSASVGNITFASTEPRFFHRSLLKFYEVSPWFSFPNNIANACILQILAEGDNSSRTLHIVDIGVSHGVQWPTLLEALTRRPGGPPPLVRHTVVTASTEESPFSVGPPGDNFSSRLLGFAKSIHVNLQIKRLDNQPLMKLNTQVIDSSPNETLIICAQFRLHHLNHNSPDERSQFLRMLRSMEPKGFILSENNTECSCNRCGNFSTGFSRKVEYLWKFLDSTSSAFKGRESEERRLMEGEAAKALTNHGEMNEVREKWCERMKEAGFMVEILGEDTIDGGRAFLRKYDNNWEMKVEENNTNVGLWWKGQPVSFCSLWKLDGKDKS
ncbi:hypothetical protein L6164_004208 [Bauhinia variegata]|uniref:Uncharacterized protein n=1 Tax=Bauhinia variegata TaxID=167791 RepID=A0ACB9Q3M6_BAUVA|nr:hypothetical protein L6164_004208 [Bauhinia variegata]